MIDIEVLAIVGLGFRALDGRATGLRLRLQPIRAAPTVPGALSTGELAAPGWRVRR